MSTSTKALIVLMIAGTAGLGIFLILHVRPAGDVSVQVNNYYDVRTGLRMPTVAAAGCTGDDCLPEVSYVDTSGTAYTKQSLKGKVVLVNFWATWCKPCLREIPDLSRAYDKYKDQGLVVLGVMTDDPDNQQLLNFQSDHEMTYPVIRASSDILLSYNYPGALPTTFIYDRSGRRVYDHVGPLKVADLQRVLDPLVAQKTSAN